MPFDAFYLNPRKVTRHPYTGEQIVCSDDDGTQHKHEPLSVSRDRCEECSELLLVCDECDCCINCCLCGNYHSVDCPWPL